MGEPAPISPFGGRVAYGLGHFSGSYYSGYQAARSRYGFGNLMRDHRQSLASEQFAGQQQPQQPQRPTQLGAGRAATSPRGAAPGAAPSAAPGAPSAAPGAPGAAPGVRVTQEGAWTAPGPTARPHGGRSTLAGHLERRRALALEAGNGAPERLGDAIPMPAGSLSTPSRASAFGTSSSFKGGPPNRSTGRGLVMPHPFVSDPPQNGPGIAPLPLSQTTSSTAGAYSSWRTPGGATPLSAETNGSTFNLSSGYERRD